MFSKTVISLFFVVFLSILVLMPQLNMPWTLIDDGEDLRMSIETERHFLAGDYGWLFSYEKENGRFRPAYWLWNFFQFKLFGNSSFNHHAGHLVLYVALCVLIFATAKVISRSNIAGVFAVILFLFFVPAAENYYRVAPIEPSISLLYLVYFFLLARIFFHKFQKQSLPNKLDYLLISLVLFFAYFMKETAIVLLPAFFFVFLVGLINLKSGSKKSWFKFFSTIFLVNIFFLLLTYLVKNHYGYGIGQGYASAYTIDVGNSISRFIVYLRDIAKEYNWLLFLSLILFSYNLFFLFRTPLKGLTAFLEKIPPGILWQFVLLSWFFLFLAIQSPWIYIMGRYLTPIIIWLALFMGIELSKIFAKKVKFIFKTSNYDLNLETPVLKVLIIFLFGLLVYSQGIRINKMYHQVIRNEQDTQSLIKYLAVNTPKGGKIHVNFSEGIMEYLYELPLHFKFYYNRPDIITDYLSLAESKIFKKGDYIITFKEQTWRYPWDDVKKIFSGVDSVNSGQFGENWQVFRLREDEILGKK